MDTYTTARLSDAQSKACLPREEPWQPLALLLLCAMCDNGRHANHASTAQRHAYATLHATRFVRRYQQVEHVKLPDGNACGAWDIWSSVRRWHVTKCEASTCPFQLL